MSMRVNDSRVAAVNNRTGAAGNRRIADEPTRDAWSDNREAMRVELSAAGRSRLAQNAVATANAEAASSAAFLVSPQGLALVAEMLPRPRR
jgi:hypothetical protein